MRGSSRELCRAARRNTSSHWLEKVLNRIVKDRNRHPSEPWRLAFTARFVNRWNAVAGVALLWRAVISIGTESEECQAGIQKIFQMFAIPRSEAIPSRLEGGRGKWIRKEVVS